MYPDTVALVDADSRYAEELSGYLQQQGMRTRLFGGSRELLAANDAYGYDFYVVDLILPGIDGAELIKVLRKRTNVGVVVLSGRQEPEAFKEAVSAGADMYLAKPVLLDQVALAIQAVQRRVANGAPVPIPWRFDRRARQLIAPDNMRIELSNADLLVLDCFIEAGGETVTRETLRERLGRTPEANGSDGLNAIIYRLRRRIERATPQLVPLQSRSRVGYVFKAPLVPA